ANSIWKGILGGVEGRVCGEELTGRSGACSRCGVREIFDKGLDNVRYEQAMKDADGNEAWFEVITTPIKDKRGAAVEAIELFVPITDRKRLEEELKLKTEHLEELVEERTKELRQSEARYRAVVEDQTEMICRFRPDWTLTFVNEAYSRFVGLKAEELIGKSFEPFILKEDLEKIRGLIMTLTPQNPTVTYEERVLMPDGKVRWQEWVDRAIFNENNEIVEIQGVGRDITERKELEDRLRAAERLAAIGETASMVGHDLRNPLQVMMNTTYLAGEYLESILKHADPQVSKEVKGLCSTMQEQIDYMNKIVSDLQDFAKPLTPQLSEIDLQQLARETVSTVKRPENVEVLFDIQEGLGRVRADAAMMKRALTNLITNAIQSMPNGGSLTISVRRERDGAVIGIADTGVGISEENLSRLFQPFFTTKAKGQGLGLAVTKRIVEAHGGEIKVKSRVGVGTLFTIKIPIGGA
ncbi:MAG: PAS domain S-box protein, partial [Candidatus Bathyarchaeia archaeon]